MNTTEERLWCYIDGSCSADEQEAIELLIAQNGEYNQMYKELLAFNAEISNMEAEAPSMGFTYKVMEGIRAEHARQPLKAVVDRRIIRGIAVFFISTIFILLGFILSSVHFPAVSFSAPMPSILKMPDIHNYIKAPIVKGFLIFDIVLGLFLLDSVLRKRIFSNHV